MLTITAAYNTLPCPPFNHRVPLCPVLERKLHSHLPYALLDVHDQRVGGSFLSYYLSYPYRPTYDREGSQGY